MYFTYVVRPATAPEVSHVSEPFWNSLMGFNLRYGFSLQFIGYLIIVIGSLLGGNFIQISGCLNGNSEHLKNVPIFVLFIGAFMYTIGTVCIQNFRNAADDDARYDMIDCENSFNLFIKITPNDLFVAC